MLSTTCWVITKGFDQIEEKVYLFNSDWPFSVPPYPGQLFTEAHLFQAGPAQYELSTERTRLLGLLAAFTNKPRPSSWDRVQGPLV